VRCQPIDTFFTQCPTHGGECSTLIHTPELTWFDHLFVIALPGQNGTVQNECFCADTKIRVNQVPSQTFLELECDCNKNVKCWTPPEN